MARTSRVELDTRKEEILRFLYERTSAPGRGTTVSLSSLAAALGVTKNRIRYTVHELEREDLIRRRTRYHRDGGQAACSFLITRRGREFLSMRSMYREGQQADLLTG